MSLEEFIERFDKENTVVLLEGKRKVLDGENDLLVRLGNILASRTSQMKFRSGNADGADFYFSQGVVSVDKTRLQVITPYTGHRNKKNYAYDTISLDNINLAKEPDVVYHSKKNKKTEKLVDQYIIGNRSRFAIKAAYIIRDTIKAIGAEDIPPSTVAIFYDDLENPKTGGTGHTMNICEQNNIPIMDQRTWFKWLDQG